MGAYGTATMTFSPFLMLLVLSASAEGSVGPSTNNSFCTESKECLEYQLVCKTDEYEVRHYSPTRWVSTDAEAYFMGVGAAMAFRRLFQYITGANEEGVQMEMTTPVLVKIPEATKMWEPAVYTLNFPLPAAYQDKPPKPTNDKLYFTDMPDMDVYVRSYGGWMLSVTSRLHAHLLTKELDRVRASYNHTYHYGVGYDSPLKLTNRHNEVWYIAEGEPVCTDPREPTPAHPPTATPTGKAPFAAALRALRASPAKPSAPSSRASAPPPSGSASPVGPSSAPSGSPLNLPAKTPSPVTRGAAFTLPFASAQSPLEPSSTNSSVGPSLEPQTASGPQNFTGPQNVTDFQTFTGISSTATGPQNVSEVTTATGPQNVSEVTTATGPQNVSEVTTATGPQNVSELHTITGPQNVSMAHMVTGPQNDSTSHTVTGPQNVSDPQAVTGLDSVNGAQNDSEQQAVTGAQDVSELQTATGPQNVNDSHTVTSPETATGSQTRSELQNDSGPWNDTAQGYPEAQLDEDLEVKLPDTQ
ncbi:endochitinase A isoform X2 [Gadus morhua]|uniref:Heme-binding protein soul5, like n=1 Tax=Gadus morhua TaxID=8049 RepID=A0A8C5F8B5_GADMO|nr:endochitinase A-like isoform X2 [Gadus morhua]